MTLFRNYLVFISLAAGLFLVMTLGTSVSWQASNYFVQFRVLTIPDSKSADAIDEKMMSRNGVIESNADHVTSTYFCILSPEADYSEEDFINWFSKLGYEIACYSKGVQNTDAVLSPHILKDCTEEKTE